MGGYTQAIVKVCDAKAVSSPRYKPVGRPSSRDLRLSAALIPLMWVMLFDQRAATATSEAFTKSPVTSILSTAPKIYRCRNGTGDA